MRSILIRSTVVALAVTGAALVAPATASAAPMVPCLHQDHCTSQYVPEEDPDAGVIRSSDLNQGTQDGFWTDVADFFAGSGWDREVDFDFDVDLWPF